MFEVFLCLYPFIMDFQKNCKLCGWEETTVTFFFFLTVVNGFRSKLLEVMIQHIILGD